MEKKKAERERLKAEKERLKQEAKAKKEEKEGATSKPSPEPEEDIVDALLKEIRAGTKLRTSTVQRPSRCLLTKEDMEKLEQMKQDNMSIIAEDITQEVSGEDTEKTRKENKNEDSLEQKADAENTEKINQENVATVASKKQRKPLHQENDTKIGEDCLEQEQNRKDTEQMKQEKQENMTTVVNLEKKVSREYMKRPKRLNIAGKQTMTVEDIE